MKKLLNSILIAFALTFALSFVAPQQATAKERQVVTMSTINNHTFFYVFTYFYACSGEYLGARADVYDSNGNLVGSYNYDEKNQRF